MQARVRFVSVAGNPLRRSCVSSARNAGETAICPGRGQPSAGIVRVECAKCRRECDLPRSGTTLCGSGATLCGERADRAALLLGRLKAACSLEDIVETTSLKVTLVATMCAQEMKIAGAPTDWTKYFQQQDVFHIQCFGTKLRHHRLNDGIRDCRKKGRDVDMCLLHLHDKRCAVGTHESLVLIVMSFALRSQCWCFEGPVRESGDDDLKRTYCVLSVCLILAVRLICFEPLLAGYLLAALGPG